MEPKPTLKKIFVSSVISAGIVVGLLLCLALFARFAEPSLNADGTPDDGLARGAGAIVYMAPVMLPVLTALIFIVRMVGRLLVRAFRRRTGIR